MIDGDPDKQHQEMGRQEEYPSNEYDFLILEQLMIHKLRWWKVVKTPIKKEVKLLMRNSKQI